MSFDRVKGDTFTFRFTTRAFATGIPTVLAGSPVLSAMEDAVDTPITTGVSFTTSSVAGLNLCTIDSSQADFEAGKEYDVYLSAGTVDSVSVIGEVVGHFSLSREAAAADLANGTDGLTALKAGIDAIPTTMRGTDNALLAANTPANFADMSITVTTGLVDIIQAAADKVWGTTARILTASTNFNDLSTGDVKGQVDTALTDVRLDELLAADSDIDGAAPPTVGSVFHELMTKTVGSFTYDQAVDSLEAVRDQLNSVATNVINIELDTMDIQLTLQGLVLARGTIGATGNDTTHLHLDGLAYGDDGINEHLIVLKDVSTGLYYSTWISDFATATDLATVNTLPITPEASTDLYWLLPMRQDLTGGSGATAEQIADAIWDEDATGHQGGGSFGQAIGDPGANTETMYDAVVTDAAGTNIAADIIVIEGQTDDIGVAGAGLTAINLPDQTMNITGNITGNLSGSVGSVTAQVSADITAISGDSGAADNLESQYDTTGLVGDTFPATQTQVSNIAATGSTGKEPAKLSPAGFVITFGENEANTEDATRPLDGTTHDIEAQDDTGTERIDVYYEFDIGSATPSLVTWHGRLDKGGGAAKNITVQAENVDASTWRIIGTINSGTSLEADTFDLFINEVGTGGDAGIVRIRFLTGSVPFSATTKLLTDQIFITHGSGEEGYENGAIWFDSNASNTGTVKGKDGIATNPVSTMGAVNTLLSKTNLRRVEVASNSTVTLAAAQENQVFNGDNWTLALAGQAVGGSEFRGCKSLTGIFTGTPTFVGSTVGSITGSGAEMRSCVLEGTITVNAAGDWGLINCGSDIAGSLTPIFDFGTDVGVSTNLIMGPYHNGMELRNFNNSGTDLFSISGQGQIIYASTCSGTVNQRGDWKVTNTGGVTITSDDNTTIVGKLDSAQAEPTGVPAANETPLDKIGRMFAALRNKLTVTADKKEFFDDGGSALWKKDLADDTTTYTESEGDAP